MFLIYYNSNTKTAWVLENFILLTVAFIRLA